MSPPFYRDWWLAAALTSTALPVGIAQAADIPTPVGVVTALSPSSTPADGGNTLHVGSDIEDNEGLLAQRYDGQPGTTVLIRPDQHLAARWRDFDAEKIGAALRRCLGER